MKIYKKSELEYKNGYLVKDDEIVQVDNEVVDLLNMLDTHVQRAEHEAGKKKCYECFKEVIEDEFVPQSEYFLPVIEVNTPLLDSEVDKTMAIMEELDDKEKCRLVNEHLNGYRPVVLFCKDDTVVSFDQPTQHRFDLSRLGNPLELTAEDIAVYCGILYGGEVDGK